MAPNIHYSFENGYIDLYDLISLKSFKVVEISCYKHLKTYRVSQAALNLRLEILQAYDRDKCKRQD